MAKVVWHLLNHEKYKSIMASMARKYHGKYKYGNSNMASITSLWN